MFNFFNFEKNKNKKTKRKNKKVLEMLKKGKMRQFC